MSAPAHEENKAKNQQEQVSSSTESTTDAHTITIVPPLQEVKAAGIKPRKSEAAKLKENYTPKIVQPVRKSERPKKLSEAARTSAAYLALEIYSQETDNESSAKGEDGDDDSFRSEDDEQGEEGSLI